MSHFKLREYESLLASWPGLVSRREREQVALLVEDSLSLLGHLGEARTLVDVGSGGGMPGIPLAIARPELAVTLLESDGRKAAFLVHAAASLALDLEVVAERAEEVGRGPRRETFDLAVCRALAAMPVVAELCLPLVRVGGRLLAMKGEAWEEAESAARLLGGGTPRVLPAPSAARPGGVVVEIEKVAPTPADYPRRSGVPARRPLR
jgi:16S rRNA (guanine527-N7)-methyltransferase